MGKPIPAEMIVLRYALDERGIEWEDASDDTDFALGLGDSEIGGGYECIYRTHWETERHWFSAVCGYGTYGCQFDLLELMVDRLDPIGFLTAGAVLRIMDGGDD